MYFGAIEFPSWLSPEIFAVGPISVKWYGMAYVAGFILGYMYGQLICKNQPIWTPAKSAGTSKLVPNKEVLEDFIFWIMLGIILGGRIGSILLYNLDQYIANPVDIIKIWKGGMSFHGGLLGVFAAVLWVSRKHKISLFRLGDIAAAATPFGLFFGRIANFINGELWGRQTDLPWGVIFPYAEPYGSARHPSQLYEAVLEGLLLFIILRIATHNFKSLTRPGKTAGLFLVFYGTFRTLVELVREPDDIFQISEYLTRGMLYSIPMILAGAWLIWRAHKHEPAAPEFMPFTTAKKN